MESACMLHTKHVKFNLKLASQCVSGSQAWPTAHQSLFHKKMPGPENKAVIVLLVFFFPPGEAPAQTFLTPPMTPGLKQSLF